MAVYRLESQGLIVQKACSLKTGELGGSMIQLVFNVLFFFFSRKQRERKIIRDQEQATSKGMSLNRPKS